MTDTCESPFDPLTLPDGNVAFEGVVRRDEDPIDVFRVELRNKPPLYGVWRQTFSENGYDFDIEIISFGFGMRLDVRNQNPIAWDEFSEEEKFIARKLIVILFENAQITKKLSAFSIPGAFFSGKIKFLF